MRTTKISRLIILLLFTPLSTYAMFCPNNFQQITIGDSLESVIAKCGKPTSQKDSEETIDQSPQVWNYYLNRGNAEAGANQASFTFDKDGKLIYMSLNGNRRSSLDFCNNPIAMGQTRDEVKAACGDPSFINKESNKENITHVKVTEVIYQGSSTTKLIFKDGVLTSNE